MSEQFNVSSVSGWPEALRDASKTVGDVKLQTERLIGIKEQLRIGADVMDGAFEEIKRLKREEISIEGHEPFQRLRDYVQGKNLGDTREYICDIIREQHEILTKRYDCQIELNNKLEEENRRLKEQHQNQANRINELHDFNNGMRSLKQYLSTCGLRKEGENMVTILVDDHCRMRKQLRDLTNVLCVY